MILNKDDSAMNVLSNRLPSPGPAEGKPTCFDPHTLRFLLPTEADPDYLWTLTELIQAEIESQVENGLGIDWTAYQRAFPRLLESESTMLMLREFHDKLLLENRIAAHEETSEMRRLADDVTIQTTVVPSKLLHLHNAAEFTMELHHHADSPIVKVPSCAGMERKSNSVRFPKPGETFLGFALLRVLGRGRAGSVYLALQPGLANREVALKVTTRPSREAQKLAKLQHTYIVPIHSVHDHAPYQALCMPYLGQTTLNDVIAHWNKTGVIASSSTVIDTIKAVHHSTLINTAETVARPDMIVHTDDVDVEPTASQQSREQRAVSILICLAKGLAHAHARGILHLDLKPGNVLITDEGQPLLLDFNLAYDRPTQDRELSGGTLPYMAPEHLEEFGGSPGYSVDERCDLFSLGVVFFEMLTGELPYKMPNDRANIEPTQLAHSRRQLIPSVRDLDPTISYGVDAIVRKLLMPRPDDRYQTAEELIGDLDRWTENSPLVHAENSSIRERVSNWRKRNPFVLLYCLIGLFAFGTVTAAWTTLDQLAKTRRHEAEQVGIHLNKQLDILRADLTDRDANIRQAALADAQLLIKQYGVLSQPGWRSGELLAHLTEPQRQATVNHLGELTLLMAQAEWLNSREPGTKISQTALDRAERWNRTARRCYGNAAPTIVANQLAWINALRKGDAGDRELGLPKSMNDLSIAECYLYGSRALNLQQYGVATAWLKHVTELAPEHFAAQLNLGWSKFKSGQIEAARERFEIAQSLNPKHRRPGYYLGLALLAGYDFTSAERKFTQRLKQSPIEAKLHHAQALANIGQSPDECRKALDDLQQLEANESVSIQSQILQLRIHEYLGNKHDVIDTRKQLEAIKPRTAFDYYVLATYRTQINDPAAALRAINQSIALDPHDYLTWSFKAALLSSKKDYDAAIAAQIVAVQLQPDLNETWSNLALLQAKNHNPKAQISMNQALRLEPDGSTYYRAAQVYALLAEKDAVMTQSAFRYLRLAFQEGFDKIQWIDNDECLNSLRQEPTFQAMDHALKTLYRPHPSPTKGSE